ncbi:MAG: trehalase family glycosidase, partial [Anaerolineae bacterium]
PFAPDATGPAILSWAEWRRYRAVGDDGRFAHVFWPLLANHRWRRRHRSWPDGAYWATGVSSGLDNQPRVPDSMHHHQHWSWVDATMQAALDCRILAQMAAKLDVPDLTTELAAERVQLIRIINDRMWHEEAGFYQDVGPDGRFIPVKSIAAYWGLWDGEIVPKKRREPFVRHLRENWAFNLPHRIPSLSADSDGYNSETGHGWRGGVWPSANYVVLKGLRVINQYKTAHAIAVNHVAKVCDVFRHTDTFWQYYAPESIAPGKEAADNAISAGGLTAVSMLLEDVIGINVDWPQRRVTWDRWLASAGLYGVRHYPLGDAGTMDLLGDDVKVVVTTDVPFTLEIRDGEQRLQTAVPAGTTEIEL